jgi:hypothetical protein
MLRGNNIGSGTTTTGTGTLTLAAPPSAFGFLDHDTWARSALAAANSQAIRVPYTIIEYTDSTFATPKQREDGIGTLTLGSSAGIANCTLARLYVLETQTGLNTGSPSLALGSTYGDGGQTVVLSGITIGTAANTVVVISNDVRDCVGASRAGASYQASYEGLSQVSPAYETQNLVTGQALFAPIFLMHSDYIKSIGVRIYGAVSSPTSSSLELALYDFYGASLNGHTEQAYPSLRIIDGLISAANPMGTVATYWLTLTNRIFIPAGFYFGGVLPIWSGGTGTPTITSTNMLNGATLGTLSEVGQNVANGYKLSSQTSLVDNPFSGINPWVVSANSPAFRMYFRNF